MEIRIALARTTKNLVAFALYPSSTESNNMVSKTFSHRHKTSFKSTKDDFLVQLRKKQFERYSKLPAIRFHGEGFHRGQFSRGQTFGG